MKKILTILCVMVLCLSACFSLIGCGEDDLIDLPGPTAVPKVTLMDGETQIAVIESKEDLLAELAKVRSKTGYKNLGWFTDKECTKPFDVNTEYDSDIILYEGWKALDLFNKALVSFDATLNIGFPMVVDADATLLYRVTEEGVDFIVDADANVLGQKYDAEIYYIDGVFVTGFVKGANEIEYNKRKIGTIKEISENIATDPKVIAIYEFITEIIDKNEIEIKTDGLKEKISSLKNIEDEGEIDIAPLAQLLTRFINMGKDEVFFDFVLNAIVSSEDVPEEFIGKEDEYIAGVVEGIKGKVNGAVIKVLDDDVTIEGVINAVLGLVDSDLTLKEGVFPLIDFMQAKYQIKTQELVDLFCYIFDIEEYPEVNVVGEVEETLTQYLVNNEMLGFLDEKVVDIVRLMTGKYQLSLETYLPIVQNFLAKSTIGDVIDMIFGEGAMDALATLTFDKLEFSYNIERNILNLPTEIVLATDDALTLDTDTELERTYTLQAQIKVDFEYNIYGEDIFVLPAVA